MASTLVAALLLVTFYLVVANRITALLHPIRLDMVDVADQLLACDQLTDARKRHISFLLDRAYSTPLAWLFVFLAPVATVAAFRDVVTGRNRPPFPDVPTDLAPEMRHFCSLWFFSIIGNSPLAAVFVFFQLALALILWLPMGSVMRELMLAAQNAAERLDDASTHVTDNVGRWTTSPR